MNLSEEELKAIATQATDSLKLQLTNDLVSSLHREVTYAATQAVREHVQEWVKENVLPDVSAILVAGKASLVNTAGAVAEKMCEQLAESMTETLQEKLAKSWERKKIFEAMFAS
jgi:hypothetical protein